LLLHLPDEFLHHQDFFVDIQVFHRLLMYLQNIALLHPGMIIILLSITRFLRHYNPVVLRNMLHEDLLIVQENDEDCLDRNELLVPYC
jgi:hypothetical protein